MSIIVKWCNRLHLIPKCGNTATILRITSDLCCLSEFPVF